MGLSLFNKAACRCPAVRLLRQRSRILQNSFKIDQQRLYHFKDNVYGYKSPLKSEYNDTQDRLKRRIENSNLFRLITAYREYGHRQANIDPLSKTEMRNKCLELDPISYGLSEQSSDLYELQGLLNSHSSKGTISDVVKFLKNVYCGPISAEFHYLMNTEEREWFADNMELLSTEEYLTTEDRKKILKELLKSQVFDNFLATKFSSVKRYGGEGAESMMSAFWTIFKMAAECNIQDVFIGMAHRGRLNLLTSMLSFPPVAMFQKMKGMPEFPGNVIGTGDVLSHLTSSIDLKIAGRSLHVSLLPNPSHLEAVNPVVVGKTRARQQTLLDGSYSTDHQAKVGDEALCIQVHGDAAFTGQGINMETLMLADLPHFTVGGSLHLIINNQLGFTTPAYYGRSSMYCSDLGKMISIPVIHVNGDAPEEVSKATKLAMAYREKFRKDIILDLVCFRRWGHNELDDPTFTNPSMYNIIHNRQSVPDLYAEKLQKEGIVTSEEIAQITNKYVQFLGDQFSQIETYEQKATHLKGHWKDIIQAPEHISVWDTGVDSKLLQFVGGKSVQIPDNFNLHNHLHKTHVQARIKKLLEGRALDWATAEALAFGSLLYQGYNIRLSGQDVGRGTFSHRHAMVVDQKTNEVFIPLNNLLDEQKGFIEVVNSPLSEEAVLGFEYGFSLESPNNLVIWEAQFGDFFNGAQIIIDTFITSGETKWLLQSGIVVLLPHGYDGAGPEHSSCRLERFLQMCDSKEDGIDGDNVNMNIVNPTTSAQYFHLLRRQVLRNFRKPLIVVAPKILLRSPAAASSLSDMAPGTAFQPVFGDTHMNPQKVKTVLFCSGKHYYALQKQRENLNINDTAIIRLEALCPFPVEELQDEIKKYPNAKKFIWSQEEHQNMGPWSFINSRFQNLVGTKLIYVGRGPLATPAVGIGQIHKKEIEELLSKTFVS